MTAAHPELPKTDDATDAQRPTAQPAFAAALEKGMSIAFWAQRLPDAPAIVAPTGDRTYSQLNIRCNQLVRALRARGIGAGDGVALMCVNRTEFAEVFWATRRAGMRLTPINWRLTSEEAAYIANDCDAKAYRGDYYTLGDIGYLDADGYLFLTDRSAHLIISGGVNIYPAEAESVLFTHPAVADAGVIGVPNSEWGEEVKAVVILQAGYTASAQLGVELIAYCRTQLAHFKCPRSVDFVSELPRHDNGKLYKHKLREMYRDSAKAPN
jgi:acyl-CoA synthetase (AMP-forming)/AMP-acid ligase II